MERGRHYMNRLINSYQRKQDGIEHAKKICYEITNKLKGGWTPVFESDNQRLYTPIGKLRELYLNDKRGVVREATINKFHKSPCFHKNLLYLCTAILKAQIIQNQKIYHEE